MQLELTSVFDTPEFDARVGFVCKEASIKEGIFVSTTFIAQKHFSFRNIISASVVIAVLTAGMSFVSTNRADAAPDTCTWTGNISTDMNDANNWTGCDGFGIPESGDSYIFPEGGSNKALSIDSFGVDPLSMNFTGTGYSLNRSGGQTLDFIGSGVAFEASEDVDINVPVTFGNGALQNTTLRAATDKQINFNSTVAFNTGIGEINVGSAGFDGGVFFNGTISGSTSQFIAQNGAYVEVSSSGNNYAATTVGAESTGSFRCESASCFGDEANDIYAGGGAVALLDGGTFSNNIVTSTPTVNISSVEAFADTVLNGDISVSTSLRLTIATTNVVNLEVATISTVTIDTGQNLALLGPDAATSTIEVGATIEGAGDGIVVGGATAILSGANTFDGGVQVASTGVLVASGTTTALGDSSFSTTVDDGGVLEIDQMGVSATLDWPLVLAGDGPSGDGAMVLYSDTAITFTGDIALTDNATIANNGGGTSELILSGEISGTGNLTFTSDGAGGSISIHGSQDNTYEGTTLVIDVVLSIDKNGNTDAIPGNLYIESSSNNTVGVISVGTEQINDSGIIEFNHGDANPLPIFQMVNDDIETVAGIQGDGIIQMDDPDAELIVDSDGAYEFSGIFAVDDSVITKDGPGTWTLTGFIDDNFDGEPNFEILGGNLSMNFSNVSGASSTVIVGSGGILSGNDSVGAVEVDGGTVSPGLSPGCLNPASLTFDSSSTFVVELAGATACSGYDQTTVAGAADLGNATLSLSLGYTPASGAVYTIINAGSITGTFAGLADGSTVTVNGINFRINYTATSVTLTAPTSGSLPSTGINAYNYVLSALLILAAGLVLAKRSKRFVFVG